MSKASDQTAPRFARGALALAVGLACGGAIAEVSVDPAASAPREAGETRGSYQVRCWQKGRLIFDETGIVLPGDIAAGTVRLRGRDRQRRPVFMIETVNATCFVKASEPLVAPPGMPGSGAR